MRDVLIVGLGGFTGSALRYLASGWVHRTFPLVAFPVGTLVVNVAGCLLIGCATALVESRQLLGPDVRIFLLIGVLGGFTTFSTFAHETMAMSRDGEIFRALANVVLQVVLGLAVAWMGYQAVRSLG